MLEPLRCAIEQVPLLHELTHGEAAVCVTDLDRYLAYLPGRSFDVKVHVGDLLKEESTARTAMRTGRPVRLEQPAELYGMRYLGIASPITDADGRVVGCIVVGLPLQLEDELNRVAGELAAAMQQLSDTFRGIAGVAGNTAAAADELEQTAADLDRFLQSTDQVTAEITRVADQTKLLGLNALIEAAHAGREGAGFGVVAREIQALAERSIRAAQEVNRVLQEMGQRNGGMAGRVHSLHADSASLRAAVAEALTNVENLAAMARTLQELASRDRNQVP